MNKPKERERERERVKEREERRAKAVEEIEHIVMHPLKSEMEVEEVEVIVEYLENFFFFYNARKKVGLE